MKKWVEEKHPGLRVEREMTTEDRSRRADAMVTSPTTGAQITFEIQYAGHEKATH